MSYGMDMMDSGLEILLEPSDFPQNAKKMAPTRLGSQSEK
jgi:hypothetical protein